MELTFQGVESAGREGSSRAAEALLAIESSKLVEVGDTRTLVALSDQEARKLFSERSLARPSSRIASEEKEESLHVKSDRDQVDRPARTRPAPELIEETEVPEYTNYVASDYVDQREDSDSNSETSARTISP